MAYAIQNDIVTLYSQDALFVADRDGDGTPDADAIARALDAATSEIDSYIGVRFALPLPEPDELLKQFCVDIALYRLAASADVQTEEHRTRYKDAIHHLKDVSRGAATLKTGLQSDGESSVGDRPRPIVAAGPERQFTRAHMRGF
ncbi:gp436 family protein [Epibacterium ulvae]|uniref:gp436 family protein n=1 Tax=Epibacterium ulvae TaxID=1156985 RepID=UPI002493BC7F|nr:DUF1320 domain-containing protein [Epibacterium ulvae]